MLPRDAPSTGADTDGGDSTTGSSVGGSSAGGGSLRAGASDARAGDDARATPAVAREAGRVRGAAAVSPPTINGGNHPLSPATSRREPTRQSTITLPRTTVTPIRSATRSTVNAVPSTVTVTSPARTTNCRSGRGVDLEMPAPA